MRAALLMLSTSSATRQIIGDDEIDDQMQPNEDAKQDNRGLSKFLITSFVNHLFLRMMGLFGRTCFEVKIL